MTTEHPELTAWRRRAEREQRARQEAEALLEARSRELMHANQRLEVLAAELREQVAMTSDEVVQAHFALDQASDSVHLIDRQGNLVRANRTALLQTGWTREEMEGTSLLELDESLTPELWRQRWSAAEERGTVSYEGRFRRAGGGAFPVEVHLSHFFHRGTPYVISVARDIGDRLHQQQDLERAREDAEQANAAKSRFLANISHEIRTPLAAIVGTLDLMGRRRMDSEERVERTRKVQQHAAHLTALIDGVLDLSRIEAGRLEVVPERVALQQLVRDVDELYQPRARVKGLELCWEVDPGVPEAFVTDGLRLRQVLSNLVGNAVRYTASGSITVTLQSDDGALCCAVQDTGPGIAADRLELIFDPFQQVNNRTGTGSGLGLAIAYSLCEALGGELGVTSELGKGSRFSFRVPPLAPDDGTLPAVGGWTHADLGGQLRGLSLLVADDSSDLLELARFWLEDAGARVALAEDGEQAIERLERARLDGQAFDAIILDMQMPGLDGPGALREARARGYRGPIIALTAHALVQDCERCLALGFDAHLGKPVQPERLVETLARALGRSLPPGRVERSEEAERRADEPGGAPDEGSASAAQQASAALPALRSTRAGDERFRPLLESYVAGLVEQIAGMDAATAAGDAGTLRTLVHRLRGTGGGYGFTPLTQASAACEEALIAAGGAGVSDPKVQETFQALRALLERVEL
ncbi:MAG: response regulator [Planctomycetes bacterium]|nr:response regulator [Planctomycetota bacterium]